MVQTLCFRPLPQQGAAQAQQKFHRLEIAVGRAVAGHRQLETQGVLERQTRDMLVEIQPAVLGRGAQAGAVAQAPLEALEQLEHQATEAQGLRHL